jgi:hypothetical protein
MPSAAFRSAPTLDVPVERVSPKDVPCSFAATVLDAFDLIHAMKDAVNEAAVTAGPVKVVLAYLVLCSEPTPAM